MARRRRDTSFTAIRVEGGILPPEFLNSVAALEAKHQTGADYGLTRSLTLKDEIARYWRIANDLYTAYAERRERADLSPIKAGVESWLVPLLKEVLAFDDLAPADPIVVDGRTYPVTHQAFGGAVPVLLTTREFDLDRADARFGDEGRRRAPHGLMQELLNASDEALWGIVANGTKLRLLRDNPSLTRPAHIEADLDLIFTEQLYADFAALWLLGHASRFRPATANPASSILEHWRAEAHQTGERALEHLRDGVTEALRALGNGFLQHPENETLRAALSKGEITAERYFQELLRLVYRLLFLFTAEERDLLHSPEAAEEARAIYADGYSLARLRERALKRRHYDRHDDLWQGLKILFRCLARGAPALGLPALGGLFGEDQCTTLKAGRIPNERLLEAIRALSFFRTSSGLARVNYRDMGTEELGSVYESLLELHPVIDVEAKPWTFGFVGEANGEKTKGSERKLTGSYYTPAALVNELIKSALEPVMAEAIKANPQNPHEALLGLRIIDPACGSGHFLLAAARRLAAEIASLEAGTDTPDEQARQHALREVVQHCIFGVDRNPLAVELCRTALWIETVEPGKPLTFLDSHIRCGDSLIGVFDLKLLREGIPDEAYKPLTGDARKAANHYKAKNRRERAERERIASGFDLTAGSRDLAKALKALDAMPEDSVAEIDAKRRAFESLKSGGLGWKMKIACDLWCAAFFAPKTAVPQRGRELVPTSGQLWQYLDGVTLYRPLIAKTDRIASEARFFHWPLEFPDVMARGGFDVVLGNPPWERIKLQEQEFFAALSPEIAKAPNAAARTRLIAALATCPEGSPERALHDAFLWARREAEATSEFVRLPGQDGGRFALTGRGDVNTYALFAELFANLARRRAGVIVPTGIATDDTTAPFFTHLVAARRLARLVDFENRAGLFPAVHSRMKFSLLTVGRDEPAAQFAFFLTEPAQLAEAERNFTLSPEQIAAINPNTRTAPVFRSRADAELTARIYRNAPVLIDEGKGPAGNPWGVSFMAMFHMSNGSHLFRTARQLADHGFARDGTDWVQDATRFVPLYEAKMIHQFDHRWATYEPDGESTRDVSEAEKRSPDFEPMPRYWVPERKVEDRLRAKGWSRGWLMGWRDITNATDKRTVIAGVVPRVGVGNNLTLMFFDASLAPEKLAGLVGCLSSLACDFVARHKVGGTHLNYFVYQQLAVLPPDSFCESDLAFIVPRVLELTYTSHAMAPFAHDLGFNGPPFPWDPDRRAHLRAELDAFYAHAYGLTRDELRYILDPADVYGADYPSETFRVLKNNEIKAFGEYRTARLVLEAWDRMVADGTIKLCAA